VKTVEPPLTVWRLINEACEQVMRRLSAPMEPSPEADRVRYVAKSWCRHNGKRAERELNERHRHLYGGRRLNGVLTVAAWTKHEEEKVG